MNWKLEPCGDWVGLYNVRDESGAFIAAAVSKEEGDLIAAAPELLEALKQIVWKVDQTQGYPSMRTDTVIHAARAAIAKATGEVRE